MRDEPDPRGGQWIDRLAPKVADLRAALQWVSPEAVADRSGALLEGGYLLLTMLFEKYAIDAETYAVLDPDTGEEVGSFVQALLLSYLHTADGTPAAGRWVGFRDLPDGNFYHKAFQAYAPDRLVREYGLDPTRFGEACRSLGGTPVALGDIGFSLRVLPRVELAVVYWLGDEDLPSRASILFDADATHYMVLDGLAILGSRLVDRILGE